MYLIRTFSPACHLYIFELQYLFSTIILLILAMITNNKKPFIYGITRVLEKEEKSVLLRTLRVLYRTLFIPQNTDVAHFFFLSLHLYIHDRENNNKLCTIRSHAFWLCVNITLGILYRIINFFKTI